MANNRGLMRGVNVVGYHHVDSGLGEVARSISRSLRDAGVDVIDLDVDATESPARSEARPVPDRFHDVTIAVVTAPQLPAVAELHPEPFGPARFRIGYWFWELEVVPADQAPAFAFIDRIWAPSRFVADAYRSSGDTPVELQPIHIAAPSPSGASRADLGLPDRFTFLTTFDHLSVIERKNPTTVIAAFREAFPGRDDVALMVKSVNGQLKPASARQIDDAVAGDNRIIVRDEHLSAGDHAALVAHADCLVSLHRSEGLGLHLAEAMWLGTPVVATRYSGNLDLMDDDSAALVEASLTPVLNGEGAYPEGEMWGQPNILQATDVLRRIESDSVWRAQLETAARDRMAAQDDSEAVGRRLWSSIEEHAAPGHTTGARARVAAGVKQLARTSTSPLRFYLNNHFELTKQEVRGQVGELSERLSGLERLSDTIDSLANSLAEVHVHHTRSIVSLRDEVAELQRVVGELGDDVNALTDAIVRLAETAPDDR
jgi:glycosyltransferase involved in cell wall biosynthesis